MMTRAIMNFAGVENDTISDRAGTMETMMALRCRRRPPPGPSSLISSTADISTSGADRIIQHFIIDLAMTMTTMIAMKSSVDNVGTTALLSSATEEKKAARLANNLALRE